MCRNTAKNLNTDGIIARTWMLWYHGRCHRADIDALAIRMQWEHGCLHRADMDAVVTRTSSSCGHGCSGHSHATKPRSVVNTDVFGMSCARNTANNHVFTPLESAASEGDGAKSFYLGYNSLN